MLALSDDIGHESVWDRMFHQVNIAKPALVSAVYFHLPMFLELRRWRPCLLRIYVACSGEAVNVYYLPL